MTKIAIDVVLLPSKEMRDKIIKSNRELLRTNENKIVLDKKSCLPHISLAMGVIKEEDLPKINLILKGISKEFSSMGLIAKSIKIDALSEGGEISSFKIKNIRELKKLHEKVMRELKNYLSYDAKKYMFYRGSNVDEGTLRWVKNYSKKHDDSNLFHPHITLGIGKAEKLKFPIKFKASKLAMCQLGNYCTCRKIISSYELN